MDKLELTERDRIIISSVIFELHDLQLRWQIELSYMMRKVFSETSTISDNELHHLEIYMKFRIDQLREMSEGVFLNMFESDNILKCKGGEIDKSTQP